MDSHSVIEALLAVVSFLIGMFAKGSNDSIKALHAQDATLTDKVHAMDTLVAGHYVKREELEKLGTALFAKARTESKINLMGR